MHTCNLCMICFVYIYHTYCICKELKPLIHTMLRNGTKLLQELQKNLPSNIIVRWRRKPRWLPVAPSKLFRIPERPSCDPEESAEMLRLFNNYRTTMRSLRQFFMDEVQKSEEAAKHAGAGSEMEEEDYARCNLINEEWNLASAAVREKRLAEQAKEKAERALYGLAVHEAIKAEKIKEAEMMIATETENAGSYITAENLDTAIEEALANVTDYNFCIDLEGNILYGRDTKPSTIGKT